jgi:hypothetical protein
MYAVRVRDSFARARFPEWLTSHNYVFRDHDNASDESKMDPILTENNFLTGQRMFIFKFLKSVMDDESIIFVWV